jgi:hypothetical protein
LRLFVVVLFSTVIALTTTALVFAGIARLMGDKDGERSGLSAPKGGSA